MGYEIRKMRAFMQLIMGEPAREADQLVARARALSIAENDPAEVIRVVDELIQTSYRDEPTRDFSWL
jgi:uncharacterized membrane protein